MTQTKIENIIKVYHSVTADGDDLEITRFYEHIDNTWIQMHKSTLNFEDMTWDNGNDVLKFTTNCQLINLIDFITPLSKLFPKVFFMYDFYTEVHDINDINDNVYWLYEGTANTNRTEFKESYKK